MKKTIVLIITLLFFGLVKSHSQQNNSNEEYKGVIGQYIENELPVIIRFVHELPEKEIIEKLPFLVVVSWKYDGDSNNGMPPKNINAKMIALEDALEESLTKTDIFIHAYSRTGNNLKEFVYYTTKQDDFIKMINKALKGHERYPIDIVFYEDKEWSEFKDLLADFKK